MDSTATAKPAVPTLTSAHSILSIPTSVNGAPQHRTRRRIAPVKTYWGGTAILSAAVLFLLVQIVIAIGLVAYLVFGDPSSLLNIQDNPDAINSFIGQTPIILVGSQLAMYLAWLSCLWWVTKYRSGVQLGKKFWTAFKDNFWLRFKKIDLLIGLGIAVGMQGFQYLVLNGLPAIFPQINMDGAGNTAVFEALDGVWFFLIAFGIGSLIGPICEELFFRGFLMRGFVNHFSFVKDERNIDILEAELGKQASGLKNLVIIYRAWASKHRYALAIILSSILFGFMHFQGYETFGQWLVVIVTGTLGLVLAIITYKLQRISPAIVAHVLYNGISFGLLLLLK